MARPRKPVGERVAKRRYPGEEGHRPAKGRAGGTAARGTARKVRKAPRCDFLSLGPGVWEWVAHHLLVPDGPNAGAPLELTGDQSEVLYRWFEVDELGIFVNRRGAWRAAQGCGKSPLMAAIALAELAGPVRFDCFKRCKPIGAPAMSPHVQVAAVSADQSQNTYRAAYLMAAESDLAGVELDVGLTRIHRIGSPGLLEPVTASAGSRLGQRLTFCVLDESSLWTRRNGGHRLSEVLRRNAAKMGGRSFEVTNAHAIGEDSVAERTHRAYIGGETEGLLYIAREAPPVDDLSDFVSVRAALKIVYGDSALDRGGWVDLDRIARDIADVDTGEDQSRRFFLNTLTSGGVTPVDVEKWNTLAKPDRVVAHDEQIALGFDGSISDDETVLYGCTADRHLFLLGAWARPEGAPKSWRIPRDEVHDAVADAFATYTIGTMYADPPKWWDEIDRWAEEYGDNIVIGLDTNSGRRFSPLCDAFATAVAEGGLSHDGNAELTQHLAACAKRPVSRTEEAVDGRARWVVAKADARKIDRAVAAILAFGAAGALKPVIDVSQSVW